MYVCVEVDFYGHFFCKAKTKVRKNDTGTFVWNESFVLDLECCGNIRLLVYREDAGPYSPGNDASEPHAIVFGKHMQQLSRKWLVPGPIDKRVKINQCDMRVTLKFCPGEVSLRRVPTGKTGALFGEKIHSVCR